MNAIPNFASQFVSWWKQHVQVVTDRMHGVTHLKPLTIAQANHAVLVQELSELMSRADNTIMRATQATQRGNNPQRFAGTLYSCPVCKARQQRCIDDPSYIMTHTTREKQ